MPVQLFKRIERLSSGRSATFDSAGNRTYTAQVRVVTTNDNVDALTVRAATGVPKVGVNFYVSTDGVPDPLALCTRADPRLEDDSDGTRWIVDLEFSTAGQALDPGGFAAGAGGANGGYQPGEGGAADDPTKRPPEWSVDYETLTRPVRRQLVDPTAEYPEWEGKAITNSAGEFFDPLPERELAWPVLTYSRVEASYDWSQIRRYCFAINDDAFLGFPPESVMCYPIRFEPVYFGLTQYFRKSYKFRFRVGPKTPSWNPRLVDVGFNELIDGVLTEIIDPMTRTAKSTPSFLDGKGRALSQADLSNEFLGPVSKVFSVYPRVKFAPLNIVL